MFLLSTVEAYIQSEMIPAPNSGSEIKERLMQG